MRYNSSDISGLATLSRRRTSEFQSPPSTPSQRNNGFFGRGLMQSSSVTDLQGMGNFPPQPQPNFHTMQQVKHLSQLVNHNILPALINVECKTVIRETTDLHYLYSHQYKFPKYGSLLLI
jgi:hypothetical protein